MSLLDDAELTELVPKITDEEALEFATLAWTFPETMNTTYDPILAKAFADIIDSIINGGFMSAQDFQQAAEEH